MTFESIDDKYGHRERFPGLSLAWETLRAVGGTTAVLNAANEMAVEAFLNRQIRFDQIHAVNLETLSQVSTPPPETLDDLLAVDAMSRAAAGQVVRRIQA